MSEDRGVAAYKRFIDGLLGWPSRSPRARGVREWHPGAGQFPDPRYDDLMAALTPKQRAYLAALLQEERETAVIDAVNYLHDSVEEITVRFYDEAERLDGSVTLPRSPFYGDLHEDLVARRMGRPWGDELDAWEVVGWRIADLLRGPAQARGMHVVGDHSLFVPGEVVWAQPCLALAPRVPEFGQPVEGPRAVIEVTAPSTAERVRNALLGAYVLLPTVDEVLVFASERVYAERYARTDAGGWRGPEGFAEPGAAVPLATLGTELPLADVYATSGLLPA